MPTDYFHPAVRRAWFGAAIPAGDRVAAGCVAGDSRRPRYLIAAPTGSGKTLAAFLSAIDQLVRQAGRRRAAGCYAGGLMSRHSRRCPTTSGAIWNYRWPAIAAELANMGLKAAPIRTQVRTGDTPQVRARRHAQDPSRISWVHDAW